MRNNWKCRCFFMFSKLNSPWEGIKFSCCLHLIFISTLYRSFMTEIGRPIMQIFPIFSALWHKCLHHQHRHEWWHEGWWIAWKMYGVHPRNYAHCTWHYDKDTLYWPFEWGISWLLVNSQHKEKVMQTFGVFFAVSLDKLLNKHSNS